VTFNYKSDTTDTPQFGSIAEKVAKANPDLVIRDHDGQPYTVRYEAGARCCSTSFLKSIANPESERAD
jgi:hypothetical protein